jgi:acetolactate synthase-1/3 small subunit
MTGSAPSHHILSVLVENRPGVLARVSGLFARRGFNIISLAVAPSDDERFSRISIVVDVEDTSIEQITKQLFKLINVVKITDLDKRSEVVELVGIFEGKIIDVGLGELTVMLAGAPEALDAFEDLVRPYGITELQRTGRVALPRLDRPAAAAKLRRVS